jgi:NitT/TauT family transport system substrate-binding protein
VTVKRIFAVLGALLLSSAAFGQPHKLNIGYTPGADQLALFVAKDKGFYEKQGIDATLTRLPTAPQGVQALVSGSLQLTMTAVPNVIQSVEGGIDLVVVRALSRFPADFDFQVLIVRPGLEAKTAADLKGKKVAVPGLFSMGDILLRKWFLNNKVALSEVTIVEAPLPQIPDLLKKQTVDAAVLIEPLRTRVLSSGGGTQLANYTADVIPDCPGIIMGAMRPWANANRPAVEAFRRSIDEAQGFILDPKNRDEARAIEAKYLLGAVSPRFPPPLTSRLTTDDFEFFYKIGKEIGAYRGTIKDLNGLFFK